MSFELPEGTPVAVEVELGEAELAELRRRAAGDELAPAEDEELLRYLVYLGAGYVEAERTIEREESVEAAHAALYAGYGQAGAARAVLRFRYWEASRLHTARGRARAAKELAHAIYADATRRIEEEIEVREERARRLKAALSDADRAAGS